jgi:hypothetical protein
MQLKEPLQEVIKIQKGVIPSFLVGLPLSENLSMQPQ